MIDDESFINIPKTVVIGLKNFEKQDEDILKKEIKVIYQNPYYIDLNQEFVKEKKITEEKGIISRKWFRKYLTKIPSVCIFCYNIYEEQKISINEKLVNTITNDINDTLNIIFGNQYSDCTRYIIAFIKVKNKNNLSHVKNLFKEYSNIFIIIIDDKFALQKIIDQVKYKPNEFITNRISLYKRQLSPKEKNEFLIKKNIKIAVLSYLINDYKIYEYFESAYNLMIKVLKEKKYDLSVNDERIMYFEIRNVCDWLLFNIFKNQKYNGNYLKHRLITHFSYFNIENFIKKENISIEIKLLFYFWKFKLYEYYSKIKTNFLNDPFCKFGQIHSLMRLIQIYNDNKNNIDSIKIEKEIKETNSNYFEKFPKYELDSIKIEDPKEIINIYYCNLIEKKVLNYEELNNHIKKSILSILKGQNIDSEKYIFYSFKIALIMNFNKEFQNDFISFLKNILYNDKSIKIQTYYPKIYNDLLIEYNKLIKDCNIIYPRDNFLNVIKKSYFEKLSNDENIFLNEFFNNQDIQEIEKNNLKYFKLNPNEIFNINYSFSNINPKILDIITLKLEIKTYLDNSIKIPIKKIQLNSTIEHKEFTYEELFELSNENPFIKDFKMFTSKNDNELTIYSIDILLQNGILFSYSFKPSLKKTIILDEFDSKDLDKHILINFQKDIQMGEFQYKYFKIDISNMLKDRIKINGIESSFNLVKRKSNDTFEYEFYTKDENNNLINKKNETLKINKLQINNDNSQIIEFILKINSTGDFNLNFDIHLNLLSLEVDNLSLKYDYENVFKILSIRQLSIKCNSISSISFGNDINDLKIKPILHPFKIQAILNNSIIEDVIIKKIEIFPTNNSINITSPITKLLDKNLEQIILSNTQFIIPFHVIVNENFNGEIGLFKLKWTSKNLESYSNELINDITFSFKDIKNEEEFIQKMDLTFSIEIIDYICKFTITNLSNKIKNVIINFEYNKENYDYLIEGKIKKKTLVYPFSKSTEDFIITPLRNDLNIVKLNNIFVQEYSMDDKSYEKIKMIYKYNPGFIKVNHINLS